MANRQTHGERLLRDPLTLSILLLGDELVVRCAGYRTAPVRIPDQKARFVHQLVHHLLPPHEFASLMAHADRDEVN